MPGNRGSTSMAPAHSAGAANTAYTLSLLSEYAYTLDALPLELSKTYADLRELDAVLSSQLAAITAKIQRLTAMVEAGTAPGAGTPEERLYLLAELAEDAARLGPGGDDKIRVACTAADGLRGHSHHLASLLDHAPGAAFDAAVVDRTTTYPHVATRAFAIPGVHDRASKRRAAAASAAASAGPLSLYENISPAKRRRPAREDDDPSYGRTPRKERTGEKPARNGGRAKKNDRGASPAESVLSVASPLPAPARTTAPGPPVRGASSQSVATTKRGRANVENGTQAAATPPRGADWSHGALEGPGIPSVRATSQLPALNGNSENVDDAIDEEGGDDQDDNRLYCFCLAPSYGDMIACDEPNCEREWFHLGCTGLDIVPTGVWYCRECLARRNAAKRGGRGGKRKPGGGRSKDK